MSQRIYLTMHATFNNSFQYISQSEFYNHDGIQFNRDVHKHFECSTTNDVLCHRTNLVQTTPKLSKKIAST